MRRFDGPALATSRGSAHDGITHTLHNRLHVGKVAVDDAWNGNDVRDALHRLAKNVIGNSKRLEETCILRYREQLLVRNHDGRVHRFDEFIQTAIGLRLPSFAFECKWLGHHSDSEGTHFTGQGGDNRSRARARAAAEPGSDEHHVRTFERLDDLMGVLERCLPPHFGIRSRA